jgi:stress response protein YsnF
MAITPNPVTAFRQSGKTPPKPPSLWESEVYGKLYGKSDSKGVKPKTTTLEEEAKLFKGAQTAKERINLSPDLTPKQKQELVAEADRIAAGERRQVSVGGPAPSLFKKLQDVAYSKILSPFKSAYKTGGDISIESQGKAWAGLVGGVINPLNRLGQSVTKELSDLQLSQKGPVGRALVQTAGMINPLGGPLTGAAATLISMGNKKEELLKRPDIGTDKVQFSVIDLVNQAKDPDWGLKKTIIAKRNVERNKFIGSAQNLIAEEITKPLNYVTGVGQVQYVGKAGRTALSAKFMTTEMLAKYPALAGKANEISRIGMWAIPREIRLAEGINTGLRLAGKPVQWTEPVADVIGKGWALTRAQIGDVARATASLPLKAKGLDVVPILAPASRALLAGAGRKTLGGEYILNNAGVVRGLAGWSAANAAKGETGFAYNMFKDTVKEIVDEAREQGVAGKLIALIEDPELPRTVIEDGLVKRYKAWQDEAYKVVEQQYKRFGFDYGTDVPDFSFIDNYVHHTISKDAKNWLRSINAFGDGAITVKDPKTGKNVVFNTNNLSYNEIVTVGAPLKYRSLKAGEEFMGRILEKGGIEEINKIFKEVSGTDVNFFETDIGNIADSYAYSLAKQKSREVFTRRLMAYGEDAAQKLLDVEIPNKNLANELIKSHKGLVAVRNSLRQGAVGQRQNLRDIVGRGMKYADDLVKENLKQRKLTEREIKATVAKLQKLEFDLSRARTMASTVEVSMRENFDAAHSVLLSEIKELRRAIEVGDGGLSEVRTTLQQTYMAMFPNAKRIPDDINILADRIMAARGAPASREARAVAAELRQINTQLDLVDPNSPEYAALVQQEGYYKDLLNGYRIMGEVRATQTYAPDNGFLYTSQTDLGSPDAPFQLLHSEPTIFQGASDVIGVHAFPDSKVVDSRTSDGVQEIFGSDNFVKSIDTQLQDAGLDANRVFIKTYYDLKQGLPLDPEIERGYPDLVNLIDDILDNAGREMPAGGDSDIVKNIYDDFVASMVGIAHMSGDPAAEQTGRMIIDSALGDVALAADLERQMDGLLLPAKLFDDTAEDTAIVVVKPQNYTVTPSSSATAPVQGADNPVLGSILRSDYTTASEAAAGRLAAAAGARQEVDVARTSIATRISELTAQKEMLAGQKVQRQQVVAGARAQVAQIAGTKQTVNIAGQKVVLDRVGITKALQAATKEEAKLRRNLERSIVQAVGDVKVGGAGSIKGAETKLLNYQDRLQVLFEQAKTLKQWSDGTGNALRNELAAVGQAMLNMPARGEAGVAAREWVRSVQRSVESTKYIKDKAVKNAYERVTQLLHVGEIGLAQAEDAVVANRELIDIVKAGRFGEIMAPVEARVLEGWEAILGLGVQAPEQLLSVWKPNLQKLLAKSNAGMTQRFLAASRDLFKTYAVTSVGFVVRNSYSSMFMNAVAGVDGMNAVNGVKAMNALNKYGAVKWLDELGIVDPVLRGQYEQALKAAIATGLQGSFTDLREPVIAGTLGERLINVLNKTGLDSSSLGTRMQPVGENAAEFVRKQGFSTNSYTRGVRRANTRVEAAVRFPMALDTILKGGSYDDAVAKVTRYHFDYSDLSKLDEAALQFVPFWIWTTRNIPNQITNQFMRPNAYNIYEKVQQTLPVDSEQVVPEWQEPREPLGIGRGNIPFLGEGYYTSQPDMPQQRLQEGLRSILDPRRLIGQAYPFIKLPAEYLAGRQLGLDVGPFPERTPARGLELAAVNVLESIGFDPIYDKEGNKTIAGFTQYALGNAIPLISRIQRLSGGSLGGKENYATRTGQSWLNELGIPITIIKDDNVRSEFINRQFTLKDLTKELISRNLIPAEG